MENVHHHVKVARALTDLLENKFGIGRLRFGLDPIIGMIPGFGDIITLGISLYLVWIGTQLKLPQQKLVEMVTNVVMDFVIGLLPFIGDFTDIVYRANSKNMKIIEGFLKETGHIVEGQVVRSN